MQKKSKALDIIHKGEEEMDALYANRKDYYDYGNMSRLPIFEGIHPIVMKDFMGKFDWKDKLHFDYLGAKEEVMH